MTSRYPGGIDGYSNIRQVRDRIDEIIANDINDLRSAIIKIEQTLGINPQDGFGTVVARITAMGMPVGAGEDDISGMYPYITVVGLQGKEITTDAPTDGNAIFWDAGSSKFIFRPALTGAATDDLSGTYPALTVVGIQGRDVNAAVPTDGYGLVWDAGAAQWLSSKPVPGGTAGGDLSGTYPRPTVDGLQGRSVSSSAPTDGYALTWDTGTSSWVSSKPVPGGTAGGDLSGTFPNPTVDAIQGRDVNSAAPADGQVLVWNSAANKWTPQTQDAYKIQLRDVRSAAPTDGQVLVWNSAANQWTPQTQDAYKIQLRSVNSAAPADGQVLVWNSAANQWTPQTQDAYKIQLRDVNNAAPNDGYGLIWNAATSKWTPSSVAFASFNRANVVDFGAIGNGIADDTAAILRAISALQTTGGTVIFPAGTYLVSPQGAGDGCITVTYDNIVLEGDGYGSVIKTAANSYIPILVARNPDSGASPTDLITGCVVRNLKVKGTGTYQYYALASGRGILGRGVKHFVVENTTVVDMSMIGICIEDGDSFINIHSNRVDRCFYTAINFNGNAHQSKISNNIVSRTTGGVNSSLIQAGGHCIVDGNTCWDSAGYGIQWGEGNWHGCGTISHNLIKKTTGAGIWAGYMGPVIMSANTLINTGGIWTQPGTLGGLTAEEKDCVISNNLLVNSYPVHISCYTEGTIIEGNMCLYLPSPVEPSSDTNYVGYIAPGSRTEIGISISGSYGVVSNNILWGPYYGIRQTYGNNTNIIENNKIASLVGEYAFSAPHYEYTYMYVCSKYKNDGNRQEFYSATTDFVYGPHQTGDILSTLTPTDGYALNWNTSFDLETAVAVILAPSASKLYVDSIVGILPDDKVALEQTNYVALNTTVSSTGTDGGGDFIVLGDVSPYGAGIGNSVFITRYLSVLLGAQNANQLQGRSVSSALPNDGYVLVWNNSASVWTPQIQDAYRIQNRKVASTAPSDGQALVWDAANSRWVPGAASVISGSAGGDLSGTYPNPTVDAIQGRDVRSATPTDGQVLVWNSAANQWTPQTQDAYKIQLRDVSSAMPADGYVLAWNNSASVWTPQIQDAYRIQNRKISTAAPTDGYSYVWNNSTLQWEPNRTIAGITLGTNPLGFAGSGVTGTSTSKTLGLVGLRSNGANNISNAIIADINNSTLDADHKVLSIGWISDADVYTELFAFKDGQIVYSNVVGGIEYWSDEADGSSVTAFIVGCTNTWITPGAKLFSAINGDPFGIERAYIDYAGTFYAGSGGISMGLQPAGITDDYGIATTNVAHTLSMWSTRASGAGNVSTAIIADVSSVSIDIAHKVLSLQWVNGSNVASELGYFDGYGAYVNSHTWGMGARTYDGLTLTNTTAAALGAQQYSPAIHLGGRGWETTGGSSDAVDWRVYAVPVQGTAVASALYFDASLNNGTYVNKITMSSDGSLTAANVISAPYVLGTIYLAAGSTVNWYASYGASTTGLGSGAYLQTSQASYPLLFIQRSRTDAASNIIIASVYDRNAASITNAATMRLHSFGWTNNSDVYTELQYMRADGAFICASGSFSAGILPAGMSTDFGISTTAATDTLSMWSIRTNGSGNISNAIVADVNNATLHADHKVLSIGWVNNADTYTELFAFKDGQIVYSNVVGGIEYWSNEADGGSVVAFTVGSISTWTTPGAKLLSVVNGDPAGKERANVDYAGNLTVNEGDNAQGLSFKSSTELYTVPAAIDGYTVIQIPAGAIVLGVSARVTTVIPTATTVSVGIIGAITRYANAINVAAGTTSTGTSAGLIYYSTGTRILIRPSTTPGAATGVMRITIHYIEITPPTS